MKRNFTVSDAIELLNSHKNLKDNLITIKNENKYYEEQVRKNINHYVSYEILKILDKIPVEDLNRDKKGIRTGLLRDAGYNSYANIFVASLYQLASIYGISEDRARQIKRIVKEVADLSLKSVKIKLNIDRKTKESTNLVISISQYLNSIQISSNANRLLLQYADDINKALTDIKTSTSALKWFFSTSFSKEKSIAAYDFLSNIISNDYGIRSKLLIQESNRNKIMLENDAWNLFKEQPVKYINVIEKICPGILENDDKIYGLPEELARKVQEECFFPDGLTCDLRPYQEMGVKYILHQRNVLLGDEMGLGKTVQAIASMVSLRNTGATHFVVICPASVIINWCREIKDFSKLSVIQVYGKGRLGALRDWIKNGGVAVTTYETTGYFKLSDSFRFNLLVVDEAHYIKNPKANRTINTIKLAQHANRLLFMTGTPLENNVDEMVNLIQVLQPNIASKISMMKIMPFVSQFQKAIAPVYYRRKRDDVLNELPELLEVKDWCSLGCGERKTYEREILNKNYNGSRRVSWNVEDLNNSAKAKRMLEIINEAKSENRKVIVFSYFLDTIRKVTDALDGLCTEPINGSISPARRQEIIDEFENNSNIFVLPAQIIAGGTGLNIQKASVVIICEPQLKPSIENQAISRAYRMGQTRNVLVYRLLAENTIDEKITTLLEQKQEIFDAFADKSVAASNIEIDSNTLGNIIQEEIDRIIAEQKK